VKGGENKEGGTPSTTTTTTTAAAAAVKGENLQGAAPLCTHGIVGPFLLLLLLLLLLVLVWQVQGSA
jgi:hypothetical protein